MSSSNWILDWNDFQGLIGPELCPVNGLFSRTGRSNPGFETLGPNHDVNTDHGPDVSTNNGADTNYGEDGSTWQWIGQEH